MTLFPDSTRGDGPERGGGARGGAKYRWKQGLVVPIGAEDRPHRADDARVAAADPPGLPSHGRAHLVAEGMGHVDTAEEPIVRVGGTAFAEQLLLEQHR